MGSVKLIPNNITVTEQFAIKSRILSAIDRWVAGRYPEYALTGFSYTNELLRELEEDAGLRVSLIRVNGPFRGFELVDPVKYSYFLLKYS